ncbi:hypothetical protein NDI39_22915 [Microcoleus sp. ZQ-A2]|nr:hypothetical protein [Microcoleus sp. FACHB-1]
MSVSYALSQQDTRHYSELQRVMSGISPKMLTQTLWVVDGSVVTVHLKQMIGRRRSLFLTILLGFVLMQSEFPGIREW